jgi:putative ABC transport system permease protein
MEIVPIVSTLRRHKLAAALIVLEIAVTCAIVCNAVFLVGARVTRMNQRSGLAEDEVLDIHLMGIGASSDPWAATERDLAALRALPGVTHAATTDMVPFTNSSWNSTVSTVKDDANGTNSALYMGSPDQIDTFGLQLVAGRNFLPGEWVDFAAAQGETTLVPSAIITRGLATKLFPGENAVGKPIYLFGDHPQTVVGIVDYIARPNDVGGPALRECSTFVPVQVPYTVGGHYILRTDRARRSEVLAAAQAELTKLDPSRIFLHAQTFNEVRSDHFKQDRAMAYLLVGVSIALLLITALGVIGLASFWVQQRTRQIGIRRALGATRSAIVRYFQVENFVLATLGIVIGMMLAYGLNLLLMHRYQVERLPATYLPIGALSLWGLGQLAVLGPALRASLIPPASATRSV